MKGYFPVYASVVFLLSFIIYGAHADFFKNIFNPSLKKDRPPLNTAAVGFYEYDKLGLEGINDGHIAGFGDFNGDKFTDVFVLVNSTTVDVYLWNTETYIFQLGASVSSDNITNIVPGDFNYDGKLDLMINGLNSTNNLTYIKIYIGDLSKFNEPWISPINSRDQLLALDMDGDLRIDLFGEIYADDDVNHTTPIRAYWKISDNGDFTVNTNSGPTATYPLAVPHSNGFVDINGDCLADIVITSMVNDTKQMEIWINSIQAGMKLDHIIPLPPGTGQLTFSDFNGDGNTDIIYPVCWPINNCTESRIELIINDQIGLCTLTQKDNCRSSSELCTAVPYTLQSAIKIEVDELDYFHPQDNPLRPLTIRSGDFNTDGYPDLLLSFMAENGPYVRVYQNTLPNRLGFARITDSVIDSLVNATTGAFFDIDDIGSLDLFILTDHPPGIRVALNNFQSDTFFLKTLGTNGVCPQWCDTSPKMPDPKPYGVNYPGGVFKFTATDISGVTRVTIATQLPQSSYLSLNTPYVLSGLGRTSSYIEQFYYGVPVTETTNYYAVWIGSTIPNSQVVVVPYQNPSKWTMELYITPSGVVFWVTIATIFTCLVITGFVYFFYKKEKKEDEKLKQEAAHLFSFDAL
eukprot:TRINITY_DN5785_c0_g1_i1.p1 TRINITY_DN5785_c0_g1~~TRINITY_DN5785_c0_g1_i1.p1  ORF type:complete len:632 (+),score=137.42 TRINITY_DN5785_c0_g1_i1:141-2036(+)